jgi:hypothetical protein
MISIKDNIQITVSELSEEEFKGWLSNVINTITKPISIGGQSIGISPLDIATFGLGKRSGNYD